MSSSRKIRWRLIQYPKIPPILSESIVIHLIRDRKILNEVANVSDVNFGRREADVIVRSNSKRLKVEVKATGQSAFEYFGPKDISADYLIWIHFGLFFTQTNEPINVLTIKKPRKFFKEPLKITLNRLEKTVSVERLQIDLDTL